MKKSRFYAVIAVVMAMFLGLGAQAQSNSEEVDFMQSIFGMEKKAIVAEFLSIEDDNPFWAIYDAYEAERKELGKKRIETLENYVTNYEELDDLKYDEIIKSMISLRKSTDKLADSYYKKVKKASGSKIAGQFFQLEAYFISSIRMEIMTGIPYIGEFDKE